MNRRNFIVGVAGLVLPGTLGTLFANAGKVHIVRKGDTLSGLAVRYGVTVSELKRCNGLKSDLIKVGQPLDIPMGESGGPDIKKLLAGTKVDRSNWQYIVAHHSAIRQGNAAIYDKNHRRRGMENGLAYHFVIGNGVDSGDGEIEIGPRWVNQLEGGHVRRREVNLHGIGVCLVGNFEETHPTRRQMKSFTALVDYLREHCVTGNYTFAGHKEIDLNHTVCPGRYFPLKSMHKRYG